MPRAQLITDIEQQLRARIEELEPLVEEHRQLLELLAGFEHARDGHAPRPNGASGTDMRRRGGRSGRRAEAALKLVAERPGITVAELADEMGIGTTYLYRVMPRLAADGKVVKNGKGYSVAVTS